MSRTLYRVTTSIAGVDEESEHYVATEAEAREDVLDWRGRIGEDTGDAWDVYAQPVIVNVPDEWPDALVLGLLNRTLVGSDGTTLMSCRCCECDGEIVDEERTNAFAEDVTPLTNLCAECADDEDEDEEAAS